MWDAAICMYSKEAFIAYTICMMRRNLHRDSENGFGMFHYKNKSLINAEASRPIIVAIERQIPHVV